MGAGAWNRRRRHDPIAPVGNDIDSRGGSLLSLSLDGDGDASENSGAGQLSGLRPRFLTSSPTPPQAPPPNSSAGDSPAPTLKNTDDLVILELADPSNQASISSTSLELETEAESSVGILSTSLDSVAGSGESAHPFTADGPILEEDTETVDAQVPAPLALTLEDEVLPWPPLLVDPTLVLPGAWPPPPGTLGRSQPSLLAPAAQPASNTFGSPYFSGPTGATSIGSVSVEVIIEDDPSVADVEALIQLAESSEAPPIHGTLDEMPVVVRTSVGTIGAPEGSEEALGAAHSGAADPSEFEDTPTEVSTRDALEDALAVLRTTEPGTLLPGTLLPGTLLPGTLLPGTLLPSISTDADDGDDESATTAEDLVSLEFYSDEQSLVDPAVRSDIDLAAVRMRPLDRIWLALGDPVSCSTGSTPPRTWIDLTLDLPSPSKELLESNPLRPQPYTEIISETTTDLRALAARGDAAQKGRVRGDMSPDAEGDEGDDWLSDLSGEEDS